MVVYKRAADVKELNLILKLQRQNLPTNLSLEERRAEGFVTVSHSLDTLTKMNSVCPHIIAKVDTKVIGYALCMHAQFEMEIEILKPMFHQINSVLNEGISFMAMGQICVDKAFRKKGVFRGMYNYYKSELEKSYDCLITKVASDNFRSLTAHKNIGFVIIKKYQADGISWKLMKWDWQSN